MDLMGENFAPQKNRSLTHSRTPPGLTAPTAECDAGFYCAAGASVAAPELCPPGAYCEEGTGAPLPCPSGTFNDRAGQASCTPCPAGQYCGAFCFPREQRRHHAPPTYPHAPVLSLRKECEGRIGPPSLSLSLSR